MNLTLELSCSNDTGLSYNSVTAEFWKAEDPELEKLAYITASLTLLLFLVGLPSNLLIMINIVWQRLYQDSTYVLLLHLAIVDFLLCVTVMPFTIISGFAGEFIFGSTDIARCRTCNVGLAVIFFLNLNVYTLALLSVDRLLFIKYAIKYYKITSPRCYMALCLCLWLFDILLMIPPLVGFGEMVYRHEIATCTLSSFRGESNQAKTLYFSTIMTALNLTVVIVTIVTSIWIFIIIIKQKKKMQRLSEDQKCSNGVSSPSVLKKLKNANFRDLLFVKVFAAIWIANTITWAPFCIRVFSALIFGNAIFPHSMFVVGFLTLISSTVVFPIIEATLIPQFRRVIHSFFRKICCIKNPEQMKVRTTNPTSNIRKNCDSEKH